MKRIIGLVFAIVCLGVTVSSQTPTALTTPTAERFSMVATLPRSITSKAWAEVRVSSYTSNAVARRFEDQLREGGEDGLVKALENAEPIGDATLSSRVGSFDLKLIRSRKTSSGRRIVAVSDRPIGFLEAYGANRSKEYKLGILVLDLKVKEGKEVGEGILLYAARVKIKNGKLDIQYVGTDPIKLRNVRKE
ncbi:MAG TPA: hypothetical protein VJU86_17245 [Pyrinomonadaceae bacterium]|nr:hypothetical protein [Pyrinomonadaceae bacterium]